MSVKVPLQNERGEQQFHVTKNLELALRYLRLENEPWKLWIDAVYKSGRQRGEE
jgi:hypothetical protein